MFEYPNLVTLLLEYFQFGFRTRVLAVVSKALNKGHARHHDHKLVNHNSRSVDVFVRHWCARKKKSAHLDIRRCYVSDQALALIATHFHKSLTHLNLRDCALITDDSVKCLVPLKKLTWLSLEGCYYITNTALKDVALLVNLRVLALDHCYLINDTGLTNLRTLVELRHLSIGCCDQITNTGLRTLKPLQKLSVLRISSCYLITQPIRINPFILSLSIDGCRNVDDQTIFSITEYFHCLRDLNIAWCNVSYVGLSALAKVKTLKKLDCSGNRNFKNGLRAVSGIQSLRSLAVRSCGEIGGYEILFLQKLTQLNVLDLTYCWKLNDNDLKMLSLVVANLSELNLSHCYRISKMGVSVFSPNINVRTEGCVAIN
jgi:hypothetical protein